MANFTKQAIMQTFAQMLETTPFDRITVSEIVKNCGISHNTFYYHYQDIYDLLNAWLASEFARYAEAPIDGSWQNNIKAFLKDCQAKRKMVYHVSNSLGREWLERFAFTMTDDAFYAYVRGLAGPDAQEQRVRDICDVCRYAVFGYFLKFLWNNMDDDVDATVEKLTEILSELRGAFIYDGQTPPK